MGNKLGAFLVIAFALAACVSVPRSRPSACLDAALPVERRPMRGGTTRNVVLVTVDGARWQEVFGGVDARLARHQGLPACEVLSARELLPNLHRHLVENGIALGAPGGGEMHASGPNYISQPGYLEIFTGRRSAWCTRNGCGLVSEPTILDEFREQEGLSIAELAVIASWENFDRVASRSPGKIVLSAGRHHGANLDQVRVSPRASALLDEAARSGAGPGAADYRPDRYTAALALEYLNHRKPRFLAVGLGDTDEYAHAGDYQGYLHALAEADRFVGQVLASLAELGDYGRETLVVVTTDHGRADSFTDHGSGSPESRKVWFLATGGGAPSARVASSETTHRLADIAASFRVVLGLPRDLSPRAGRPIRELVAGQDTRAVALGQLPARTER